MKKLTLIKRSVPVCPACNMLKAMLDGEGIEYTTIDITEQTEAIEDYSLTSVPVMIIEGADGEYIRLNGVRPVDEIKELLSHN